MIFLIIFAIVILVAQFYLLKHKTHWIGLILPIATFVVAMFDFASDIRLYLIIISILLFLIYGFFRTQKHRNTDIEKMNIKDL